MRLSRIEKDNVIVFNEREQVAEIEVYNRRMKRTLDMLCQQRPNEIQRIALNEHSCSYIFPKSWIRIKPKRILSPAQSVQLQEARKRLKAVGGSVVL